MVFISKSDNLTVERSVWGTNASNRFWLFG